MKRSVLWLSNLRGNLRKWRFALNCMLSEGRAILGRHSKKNAVISKIAINAIESGGMFGYW